MSRVTWGAIYGQPSSLVALYKFPILVLCCLLCVGCGSLRLPFLPPTVQSQPHSLSSFDIIHAYTDDSQVYLEYLEAGHLHRAESSFSRLVAIDNQPALQDFKPIAKKHWKKVSQQATPVRIFSESYWFAFEAYFFEHLLGAAAYQTANYSTPNSDVTDTEFARPDFDLLALLSGPLDSDSRQLIMVVFQQFLTEYKIPATRLLFNAGENDAHRFSLVYVDVAQRNIDVLHLASAVDFVKPAILQRSFWTDSSLSLNQFSRSLTLDVLLRPVSSSQRLAFLLADTSVDNLKRTSLSLMHFPRLSSQSIPPLATNESMDIDSWEMQLDQLTGRKASRGTLDFLIDGHEFFPRFIDAINHAEDELALQFYIFDSDDFALKIADLLREKSNDNIDVKVIYDGSGSLAASWTHSTSQPAGYIAPVSIGKYLAHDSEIDYRALGTPWLAGDHRKLAIVDKHTAFVGGMNLGREYRYDWHDLMMQVQGPIVADIQREFDKSWAYYGWWGDLGYLAALLKPRDTVSSAQQGYPIRVLRTKPNDSEIYKAQLAAIRRAQQYIYIHNSYLTDDVFLYELARARRRGVDVRVVMSLEIDAGAVSRSNILVANTLIEHGIRVFIYPRLSHVKAAIYDGWACVGSANFDHFSLRVNKELNLATSDPEAVRELKQRLFEKDFAESVELTQGLETQWTDTLIEIVADHM